MKKTPYLYDESVSPAGMVSVSQIQTFLSCRKKWKYNYTDNIKPRVDRSYLTIGKLCHVGMQTAMQRLWDDQVAGKDTSYSSGAYWNWIRKAIAAIEDEWKEYMTVTPFLPEEVIDMEQLKYDAISVFAQAFEEFQPWNYSVVSVVKNGRMAPALELHFKVPCPPSKGLHGYVDAILKDKDTGFIWCTDYKFRRSLAPDTEETHNIQNAVYIYACKKMGIPVTGTMTWQHLNTPAAEPQLLKNGAVSRSKIKTTWTVFKTFCEFHGINPDPYEEEMREKLSDIEWYRATYEYRNEETINNMWKECVIPVVKEIKTAGGKNGRIYRSLYPWNCKMCQYQSLCQAELRGYDIDAILKREYVVRNVRNGGETDESGLAPAT